MSTEIEIRNTRKISWIKAARKSFEAFPDAAQSDMFDALTAAAEGGKSDKAKPFFGLDGGVVEIALRHRGDAYRSIYAQDRHGYLGDPRVSEEIQDGNQDSPDGSRSYPRQAHATERGIDVTEDELELVRGSGNVYRDFARPNAGLEQARTIAATRIIRILDDRKLSTREAETLTGVAHTEFSRIRNTRLRRFTLDRLIAILGKLDENLEVRLSFETRKPIGALALPS